MCKLLYKELTVIAIKEFISEDYTPLVELVDFVNDNNLDAEFFTIRKGLHCFRIYCQPKYELLKDSKYNRSTMTIFRDNCATVIDLEDNVVIGSVELDSTLPSCRDGYQIVFEYSDERILTLCQHYDLGNIRNTYNVDYIGDNLKSISHVTCTDTNGYLYSSCNILVKTSSRFIRLETKLFNEYFSEKLSIIKNGKMYSIPWWYEEILSNLYDGIVLDNVKDLDSLVDENCKEIEYSTKLMEKIVDSIDDKFAMSIDQIKRDLLSYPEEYVRPYKASTMFSNKEKLGQLLLRHAINSDKIIINKSSLVLYGSVFSYTETLSDIEFPSGTIFNGTEIKRSTDIRVKFPITFIVNDTGRSSKVLGRKNTRTTYYDSGNKFFFNDKTEEVLSFIRDMKTRLGELLIVQNQSELNWKITKEAPKKKSEVCHVTTFVPYHGSKTNRKRKTFDQISEDTTVIYMSVNDNDEASTKMKYMQSSIIDTLYKNVVYATILVSGIKKAESLPNFVHVDKAIEEVNHEYFILDEEKQIVSLKEDLQDKFNLLRIESLCCSSLEERISITSKDKEIQLELKKRQKIRESLSSIKYEDKILYRKLCLLVSLLGLSNKKVFGEMIKIENIDTLIRDKYPLVNYMFSSGINSTAFEEYVTLMDRMREYTDD